MFGVLSEGITSRDLWFGAVGASIHAVCALVLWTVLGFEAIDSLLTAETAFAVYLCSGMLTTGAAPAVLWSRWQSITPAVIVVGLVGLGALGTWQTNRAGLTPVGPTHFGWYTLLWPGVVLVVVAAGVVERQTTNDRS